MTQKKANIKWTDMSSVQQMANSKWKDTSLTQKKADIKGTERPKPRLKEGKYQMNRHNFVDPREGQLIKYLIQEKANIIEKTQVWTKKRPTLNEQTGLSQD